MKVAQQVLGVYTGDRDVLSGVVLSTSTYRLECTAYEESPFFYVEQFLRRALDALP